MKIYVQFCRNGVQKTCTSCQSVCRAFSNLFLVRREILDMHQACQGTDMGNVGGAAEYMAVMAQEPRDAGTGSEEPGTETACGARQDASP